jgi:hypothetical protein
MKSIALKCKARTSGAVNLAASRERLGYLAITLGLVGLRLASSGPHAARGVSGLLWLAFVAVMSSTPGEPWRAPVVGKDHELKKGNDGEIKGALVSFNYPQLR